MTTKSNIGAAVDALGKLNAEIAELTHKANALKDEIKSAGDGAYEGDLFRATVSTTARETLDMKAVREKLSRQFIQANTNVTSVTAIKVVSRNGNGVK